MEAFYWEVQIHLENQAQELVLGLLDEAQASGVEELAQPGAYRAFFPSSCVDPKQNLAELFQRLGLSTGLAQVGEAQKKPLANWQENWKEHFKPLAVGKEFVIRPPWEAASPGKREIIIQPGQGFGTGYHESTRLALLAVEELGGFLKGKSILDIGAGSGILTLAAFLLGAKEALALEIEAEALAEIHPNFELTGFDPALCRLGLHGPEQVQGSFGAVFANITGDVLLQLMPHMLRLLAPGGRLVLSGIVETYLEPLRQALAAAGLQEIKHLTLGEWNGLVHQAPAEQP